MERHKACDVLLTSYAPSVCGPGSCCLAVRRHDILRLLFYVGSHVECFCTWFTRSVVPFAEHLAAVEIMQLKHIIILQNKIDLISESAAQNQHEAIQVRSGHRHHCSVRQEGSAGCCVARTFTTLI